MTIRSVVDTFSRRCKGFARLALFATRLVKRAPQLLIRPTHQVAVAIPMYHPKLNAYEEISLQQCGTILGKYPLHIVCPEGFAIERDAFSKFTNGVRINYFRPDYFLDIAGYNRLMLSAEFYRAFSDYQYVLIHQLDAFVFKDELNQWCDRSYDYIGAPWVNVEWPATASLKPAVPLWSRQLKLVSSEDKNCWVGNGGFSLRNVKTFLTLLSLFPENARTWEINEDVFWAIAAPEYWPFFKKPPADVALNFAFELDPRECFEKTNRNLPFGCHAWWKYDLEFWRPILAKYGYSV